MGGAYVRKHLMPVYLHLVFGLWEEMFQQEEENSCLIIQDAEIKE